MRVLSVISPQSGCELGCEIVEISIAFETGKVYASGTFAYSYFVDGTMISQEFPAADIQFLPPGTESSTVHTFAQCYNFAADASYELKICVDYMDASGLWQQDCKTFTIVSNGQVFAGNINGNQGFCSDGYQNTGALNIAGSFGSEYTWYYSNSSTGGGWVDLNNPTDLSYNYGPLSETTYYKVIVENGFCPPDSSFHEIQMSNPAFPGILHEDVSVCKGDNFGELWVEGAVGVGYVWYEKVSQWEEASYIGNTDVYQYQDVGVAKCFRVAVVNPGCPPALTNEVCMVVDDITEVGDITIGPSPVCVESHNVDVTAVGSVTENYQWQSSIDNSIWTDVGINASNFSENDLIEDVYYRLIVKNGVCPPDTSEVFLVEVNQSPMAPNLLGDANYCQGANSGTIDQVGLSVGSQLAFEQSTDDGVSWSTVPFTGTHTYNNLAQSTWYRLIYENGVCPNDTSNTVTVILDPMTFPGVLENDSLICTGNFGELNLTNNIGGVVKWQTKTINANSWTDINTTDDFYSFSNLEDTTLFRVIVQSGVCPEDTSNIITLDYVLGPDVGTLTGGGAFCIDDVNSNIMLTDHTGSVVDWEISYDGTTFAGIGNTAEVYTANGLTQTVWYRVALELNNCPIVYTDTVEVNVSPLSDPGVLMQDATFCEGEAISFINLINYTDTLLKFEYSDNGGNFWLDALPDVGEDTLTYNLNTTTLFRAFVQSGVCPPVYSDEVKIIVNPLPQLDAGEDQMVYENDIFELNGQTDAINYFWTPADVLDDANSLNPLGSIVVSQYFYFYGSSDVGCSVYDSVYLEVLPPDPVFDTITNAITVNGDGYNDFWVIKGIENYPSAKVELIDKWGRRVFYTTGYNNDFNGEEVPAGNYFYLITFDEFDRVYKGILAVYKD